VIPLKDDIPRVRKPVAVVLIILANLGMQYMVSSLPPYAREAVTRLLGVVPARYIFPDWAAVAGFPPMGALPFFSYMFLHAGWWHVIMNMWMLWIFADNIEDVMGPLRFLVFYVLCGLAALALHMAFNLTESEPIIGASGAVAGVLGAYITLYPRGRVLTLIPILIFPWFVRLPAWLFLGFWFATQVLAGLYESLGAQAAGIAWWAHVGGFLAGMALVRLFMRPEMCVYCEYKGRNFRFS